MSKTLGTEKESEGEKEAQQLSKRSNPEEKHKKQIKQHRSKKSVAITYRKRQLEQTREGEDNEKSATDAVTENDTQEGWEGTRRRKEGDVGVKEKRYCVGDGNQV